MHIHGNWNPLGYSLGSIFSTTLWYLATSCLSCSPREEAHLFPPSVLVPLIWSYHSEWAWLKRIYAFEGRPAGQCSHHTKEQAANIRSCAWTICVFEPHPPPYKLPTLFDHSLWVSQRAETTAQVNRQQSAVALPDQSSPNRWCELSAVFSHNGSHPAAVFTLPSSAGVLHTSASATHTATPTGAGMDRRGSGP